MISFLEFFVRYFPDLLSGIGMTLLLTAEGILAGLVLGLAATLARTYGGKFWRSLAIAYIELFRGTPLLVQLFLLYYGLPGLGIALSREWSAFLALGLNSGAYQAEYLRGSILAVGEEQMLAARAIGMSKWQAIFYIILPQALRLAIPAWANEPVSLLKASSVVFLIAVPELMTRAKMIASRTYDPIRSYLAAAVLYLILVYLVDAAMKWLEQHTRLPGLSQARQK
ncbi:MAG: amino acid ABC transporter permease [Anaerolineales bacterium]|nr:amino acid ABC transporter permease [Anaerolineales bacterium]MDW8160581.1 amino acid ABC transporter permease [Anaerolineales bacterium]